MIALRTSVFVCVSNEVQQFKRGCFKEEPVDSKIFQLMLFKVLRRVYLLLLNLGLWRIKWEALNHNYKVNLNNFGSCT